MKFFLNSQSSSYLRSLETEFGESTNSIRQELNKFEKAGLLTSSNQGNKKMFRANTGHPLFQNIHNILLKHIGIDQVIDKVINQLGGVDVVLLVGDFAQGIDRGIIDLVFVGEKINKSYLLELIDKAEKIIDRKIRYLVYANENELDDFNAKLGVDPLVIYRKETKTKKIGSEGRK